jgi:hypothetical protein
MSQGVISLKLHIAGLNFFHCDNCRGDFKMTPDDMKQEDIICPSCHSVVPQENALSHRTIQVNTKDTVATIKEKIHDLYEVDLESQNLLLLNTSFEKFEGIDDYSDNSDDTESEDDETPRPVELANDSFTLEAYGIKDGAQIVDVIDRE